MKKGMMTVVLAKLFMNHLASKARRKAPKRPKGNNRYGVSYGAHKKQVYDLYYPDPSKRNGRLIIDVHGGAFVCGDCKDNWPFARFWLEKGYDFIAIDYRLCNGKISPMEQLSDCAKALNHIAQHLADYALQGDSIFLTGDSAGGMFAALLMDLMDDKACASILGIPAPSLYCKGTLLNCPVFDLATLIKTSGFNERACRYAIGRDYSKTSPLLSPANYPKSGKGPLFVSTCTNDFLRNEAYGFRSMRKKSRLPIEFLDLSCGDKKVGHVHNVTDPFTEEGLLVNEAMHRFIESVESEAV